MKPMEPIIETTGFNFTICLSPESRYLEPTSPVGIIQNPCRYLELLECTSSVCIIQNVDTWSAHHQLVKFRIQISGTHIISWYNSECRYLECSSPVGIDSESRYLEGTSSVGIIYNPDIWNAHNQLVEFRIQISGVHFISWYNSESKYLECMHITS